MRPVVVFDRLHARDAAGSNGRARGVVSGVSFALEAGVHAILGAPEDGTLAICDALSGARAPQRGSVTVIGREPWRSPFVRARMGVLGPEPQLPSAPSVSAAVRLSMRARGESADRLDAVLDPLGLSHLHARSPRSLAFAEERAVELALALSTPAPILVALHEPLADVAVPRPALVAQRLRELASRGACVLITTSSPSDARALADRVLVLHRGVVAREALSGEGLVLEAPIELIAWVRAGARELSAALSRRPEVRAVAWEEGAGAEGGWPGASAVRVRGDAAEACALALAAAAVEAGVEVEAIEQRAPGLGEVRAATEGLWKMARSRQLGAMTSAMASANAMATAMERARAHAQAHAQAHAPAEVSAPAAPEPEVVTPESAAKGGAQP